MTDQSVLEKLPNPEIAGATENASSGPEKPDKRVAIMRAAERLFHNRRFHEVTLDEVAVAAGVGKGTIYRYFNDKDDLIFQVATTGFEDLCARVEACVAEDRPLRERLLSIVRAMCDYFDERIEMYAIIHAETAWMPEGEGGVRARWLVLRQRLPGIVRQAFLDGIARGEVRADLHVDTLDYYFLGLTRVLIRDLNREIPLPENQERIVDLFLQGVAPRPAANENPTP